jgi:two-component system, response regulator RegA
MGAAGRSADHAPAGPGSLLLVEDAPAVRARLTRALTAHGFAVTAVADAPTALAAAAGAAFDHAVVEMRPSDGGGDGLGLVRDLRGLQAGMRIAVVTDRDSFATVILALRAGADDYLAKPLDEAELVDALLGRRPALPPVPETPLGIERVCWEHVQRVLEQCGRNVSETARRLRMHRRTLQRMLSKRSPYPRGGLPQP